MGAVGTDLLIVERAGVQYQAPVSDVVALANEPAYAQEIRLRMSSGSTAVGLDGATITVNGGTVTFGGPTGANRWLSTNRKIYTGAAVAGTSVGIRTSYAPLVWGGSAGVGGLVARLAFGQVSNVNGGQAFFGIKQSTVALPTVAGGTLGLLHCLGMGYDTTDADTGNWQFYRNDGAGNCTKVDLGANAVRNTTHGYLLEIFLTGGDINARIKITNLSTGVVVLNTTYNTDVPGLTTALAVAAEMNNGAVAASAALSIADINCQQSI